MYLSYLKIIKALTGDIRRYQKKGYDPEMIKSLEIEKARFIEMVQPFLKMVKEKYILDEYIPFIEHYYFADLSEKDFTDKQKSLAVGTIRKDIEKLSNKLSSKK